MSQSFSKGFSKENKQFILKQMPKELYQSYGCDPGRKIHSVPIERRVQKDRFDRYFELLNRQKIELEQLEKSEQLKEGEESEKVQALRDKQAQERLECLKNK